MLDQLLMNNYLLVLKSTVEVYVHGTLESSNENIRKLLKKGLDSTMQNQADTYELMVKNNWYNVTNIKASDIRKVLESLQ